MNIIATAAAEIIEFIQAEIMIQGTEMLFTSNEKTTGRLIEVPASQVIARIEEAAKLGVSVREFETGHGNHLIQIHTGGSAYGTYQFKN